MTDDLKRTPLYDLHIAQGGRMVGFAGYALPVQYPPGVLKEHLHTRTQAGLFDVSHMSQIMIRGTNHATVARALESLIPVDIRGLPENRQRYGFLTDAGGGIRDDLMLTRRGDHLLLVVNAACKADDLAYLRDALDADLTLLDDRALLALQGPKAETALAALNPQVRAMRFLDVAPLPFIPPSTNAERIDRDEIHRRTRMAPPGGRPDRRRHHRTCRDAAGRYRLRGTARGRHRGHEGR